MGKTNFNMQMSDTQKELMDFITDVVYFDQMSKAGVVVQLFREKAYSYLNLTNMDVDFSDEMLLSLLLSHKKEEDSKLIGFMGTSQYRKLIDEFKQNYPDSDSSYQEQLLNDFIEKNGEVEKNNG